MNVLHVSSTFAPAWAYGGQTRSVYEITKRQSKDNTVHVLTTDALNEDERISNPGKPECIDGVKVYQYRNLSNSLSWNRIYTPVLSPLHFLENAHEYDVIHVHGARTFLHFPAYYYSRLTDTPLVFQPRGSLRRVQKANLKKLFDRVIGERMVKNCSSLFVSSDVEIGAINNVFEVNDRRIDKIPNGIYAHSLEELPSRGDFRGEYDIDRDEKVVLYLGRIHERKGLGHLVEAFDMLNNEYRDRLVIVGPDQGYRQELQKKVVELDLKEEVLFTGPLYDDDKLAAYRDSDVFVLPSDSASESFGNVVLESMACGTPVVMTEYCGVAGWIDNEHALSVAADASELAPAIEQQLEKKVTNEERSELISYTRRNFSWEQVNSEIEEVYNNLM